MYRNGQRLEKTVDYTETSTSSVTLTFTPNGTDRFVFITNDLSTSEITTTAAITHTKLGTDYNLATYLDNHNNNLIFATDYGVVADSDGTTGNGTDDTVAWQAAIAAAKADNLTLIGPSGKSRVTAPLEMSKLVAVFYGDFRKDHAGSGITITEGGSVYTVLDNPRVIGMGLGTSTVGSKGFDVIDSRVKIRRGLAKNNGGQGYYHEDDDGNNNHCELELLLEDNGGTTLYNFHLGVGAEGNDSNNWKVDIQTFSGGGGLLVEADAKDWVGRVRSEDSTLVGLNLVDGNRIDLNVYLENAGVNDYSIGDNVGNVILTGRYGSGTTNSNTTYWLRSGGNDRQVRGDTIGIIERVSNVNLGDTGTEYMTRTYSGSSSEVMFKERYFGNGDVRLESIDRADSVTVLATVGLDESRGSLFYGGGTDIVAQLTGTATPEGAVIGNIGDTFINKSGGAGTTLYVKESGSGTNTGWVGK